MASRPSRHATATATARKTNTGSNADTRPQKFTSPQPDSSINSSPRRIPGATTFSGKTLEEVGDNGAIPIPVAAASQPTAVPASANTSVTDVRLIERTPPEYPQEAERNGIEGAVDLSFLVSPQGEVHDVAVLHAQPSSIFNRAAIAAVLRWKYRPKTVNGVPVEAHVQLRLTFKLDERQ
jgi:TonB family protein